MAEKHKLYGYRWVVLAVFMFINLTIQMLWIAYAPITGPAAEFYGVTDLQIGLLAMTFMIAFIPLSIPAFRAGVVVFVYIMEAMKSSDGSFTPSLLLALGLLVVSGGLVTQMKDPEKLSA